MICISVHIGWAKSKFYWSTSGDKQTTLLYFTLTGKPFSHLIFSCISNNFDICFVLWIFLLKYLIILFVVECIYFLHHHNFKTSHYHFKIYITADRLHGSLQSSFIRPFIHPSISSLVLSLGPRVCFYKPFYFFFTLSFLQ